MADEVNTARPAPCFNSSTSPLGSEDRVKPEGSFIAGTSLAVAMPAAWQLSTKTSRRFAPTCRSAAVKASAGKALAARSNGSTSCGRR